MNRFYLLLLFCAPAFIGFAQDKKFKSTLREQSEYFQTLGLRTEKQWDSLNNANHQTPNLACTKRNASQLRACNMEKKVFGWHPYWVGSVYANYQWDLMTDFCYFDYSVSSTTGNNTNTSFAWSTSAAVTAAQNAGVRTGFCATLFSDHTTFFNSSTAQQTFITNAINLLQARNATILNIDFEGMSSTHKAPFTAFMQNLNTQLKAAIPNAQLSIALYSVDWSGTFDLPALNNIVDLMIIMGYDYYYSGSSTAGPTAPLYNFQTSYNYTYPKSIAYYLKGGVSASKLLMAVPYYGRQWQTTALTVPSSTVAGTSASKIYNSVRQNTSGFYTAANKRWDNASFTPYYAYTSGGLNYQCFIDDAFSLQKKYDVINQLGIGGIGIWALGYDDGYTDLWDAIKNKFTDCKIVACQDSIFDMGGPERNYNNNDNFTYTIAPTGASQVALTFQSFSSEAGYDSLFVYNGNSTAAPLLGKYSGTATIGTLTGTNGTLTLRFKSDNATVSTGFKATYSCSYAPVATDPITEIYPEAPAFASQNFDVNFFDYDTTGAVVEKSYYAIKYYTGTEWRANPTQGFFNDDFSGTTLHSDWTNYAGTWAQTNGFLTQTNESLSNTVLTAPLTQNLSNRYVYHWRAKMGGTGTNRRAGLHFFCDAPQGASPDFNRGNSYFVFFRTDSDKIQIYECVNNVFTLNADIPYTLDPNVFYDYKVSYDRTTGVIEVWVNDVFAATWTDATPLTNGAYISFRTGNCTYEVDNIEVLRSRNDYLTVTVGATAMAAALNPDPLTPACRIISMCENDANYLSDVVTADINIDWTPPLPPAVVNDGLGADTDSSPDFFLRANWTACVEPNSGIERYWWAAGTTPGGTDVEDWFNNDTPTAFRTRRKYDEEYPRTIYISVKGENRAGLFSDVTSSDGILIPGLRHWWREAQTTPISIQPNPFTTELFISLPEENQPYIVNIYNTTGQLLLNQISTTSFNVPTSNYASGLYIIECIDNQGNKIYWKLIKQ